MTEFFITKGQQGNGKERLLKAYDKLKEGNYLVKFQNANRRSIKQNNFYWLLLSDYIQPALYNLGYREIKTKEDAHSFCADKFLKVPVVNHETGEIIGSMTKSTATLTTIEKEEYRQDLNQFAAEYLGIVLPDPQQQLKMGIER